MRESTKRVIGRSIANITWKYSIDDPESNDFSFNMFRDCYSRNHFGRIGVEALLCNSVRISPILDPMLQRMRLDADGCPDKNLLVATVFTRYGNDLLEFPFDGGRHFERETIEYARQLCVQFPFDGLPQGGEHTVFHMPEDDTIVGNVDSAPATQQDVRELVGRAFESEGLWTTFCSHFYPEFYDRAREFAETRKYFPMRHEYAVIAVSDLLEDAYGGAVAHAETRPQRLERWQLEERSPLRDNHSHALELARLVSKENAIRVNITASGADSAAPKVVACSDAWARVAYPAWAHENDGCISAECCAGTVDLSVACRTSGKVQLTVYPSCDNEKTDSWLVCKSLHVNDAEIAAQVEMSQKHPVACEVQGEGEGIFSVHIEWGHPAYIPNDSIYNEKEAEVRVTGVAHRIRSLKQRVFK